MVKDIKKEEPEYFIFCVRDDFKGKVEVKPSKIFKVYGHTFFTHEKVFEGWIVTNKETGMKVSPEYWFQTEDEAIKEAKYSLYSHGRKLLEKGIKKGLKI